MSNIANLSEGARRRINARMRERQNIEGDHPRGPVIQVPPPFVRRPRRAPLNFELVEDNPAIAAPIEFAQYFGRVNVANPNPTTSTNTSRRSQALAPSSSQRGCDEEQSSGDEEYRDVDDNTSPNSKEIALVIQLKTILFANRYDKSWSDNFLSLSVAGIIYCIQELGGLFEMQVRYRTELIDIACSNYREVEGTGKKSYLKKLACLAEYTLLPKLAKAEMNIRTWFGAYESLVGVDEKMVIRIILVPMMRSEVPINQALIHAVNMATLLHETCKWLDKEETVLSEYLIRTLKNQMGSSQEFPAGATGKRLFCIFGRSIKAEPTNIAIGSFIYGVYRRCEKAMARDEISTALEINEQSETMFKEPVTKILNRQLLLRFNKLSQGQVQVSPV